MGVRSLGNALASFGYKFGTTGLEAVTPPPIPEGLTATGGVISDYTDSGVVYRAHVFTTAGTFIVSDLGILSSVVAAAVVVDMVHQEMMLKVVAVVLVLFTQRIQQSHHHKENLQSQFQFSLILLLLVLVDLGLQVQMPWVQMVDIQVLSA